MRALLLIVALAACGVMLPGAPAEAAKKPTKRAKLVCVKKVVTTKSGRAVRRRVCRKRRTTRRTSPKSATPPATVAPAPPPPATGSPVLPRETGTVPVAAGAAPGPVAAAACVAEDTEWLTITAYDLDQQFRLRFSRTCLRAGRTIVQYRNDDAQDHDLHVEGVAPAVPARTVVARVAPEAMEQAEVQLEAGSWRFFCKIPGHGSMTRTVTVTSG